MTPWAPQGAMLEALYPRVESSDDTRHFVETVDEDPDLFDIADEVVLEEVFLEF